MTNSRRKKYLAAAVHVKMRGQLFEVLVGMPSGVITHGILLSSSPSVGGMVICIL